MERRREGGKADRNCCDEIRGNLKREIYKEEEAAETIMRERGGTLH